MSFRLLPRPPDVHFRADLAKLACLFGAMAGLVVVFALTPSLYLPTGLSIVATLCLGPVVSALERRGLGRMQAILLLFVAILLVCGGLGAWALQSVVAEWDSFRVNAPRYFAQSVARLQGLEAEWKAKYSFLADVEATQAVMSWGETSGKRLLASGGSILGDLASCLLLGPFLTFVFLSEGGRIRRAFFGLVPNRWFESSFMITSKILTAFSDYIRAKLVEALMVGLLCWVGFLVVGAPYAFVLAVIAGATNILPYVGPIIGAVPGLLMCGLDPSLAGAFWPVLGVYVVANVIDTVLIFPVMVAKLVNLHPAILIVVVMVGGQYYGLVGMLLSIPIATGIKVVLSEVHAAVYGPA